MNDCGGCVANYLASECIALTLDDCPCENCLVKITCMVFCNDLEVHLEKAKKYIKENNS